MSQYKIIFQSGCNLDVLLVVENGVLERMLQLSAHKEIHYRCFLVALSSFSTIVINFYTICIYLNRECVYILVFDHYNLYYLLLFVVP